MELRPASPQQALPFIDRKSCGAVYPLSIVGGFQQGDCFICGDNALLWHKCGFAYTFGDAKRRALKKIHKQFLSPEAQPERRFLLFVTDEKAWSFFEKKKDLVIGTRYFFEFRSEEPAYRLLPKGMHLREIDGLLFDSLPGRITPPFSWDNATQFITFGHGYCIMDMENGSSYDDGSYRNRSYRGRDSMGRFTSRDDGSYRYSRTDYSGDRGEFMERLQNLMEYSPDKETRASLKRMLEEMHG